MNQNEVNPPRTIGQASAETEALIRHLENAEIGKVITYREMTTVCKADVQENRTHLTTARRVLLKQGIAFGVLVDVGIRRLANEEIPDEAGDKVRRARRVAKKGLDISACADLSTLTPDKKIEAITTTTVLGFMAAAGSRKTLRIAEQAVRANGENLKVGDVALLFGK